MRISSGMLSYKTNHLKNLIYLLLNLLLILLTADDKSFGNNLSDCHTWVKRCYRILENHLDLSIELLSLMIRSCRPNLCTLLINVFLKLTLFLCKLRLLFVFTESRLPYYFRISLILLLCCLDIILIRKSPGSNSLSLKIYITRCNIVELDD